MDLLSSAFKAIPTGMPIQKIHNIFIFKVFFHGLREMRQRELLKTNQVHLWRSRIREEN